MKHFATTYFLLALQSLALGLVLAACGTERKAVTESAPAAGAAVAPSTLSPQEERRYEEYFYAALTQKTLEHYDAYYELLDEALRVNPNAPEALFEKAQLCFAMASYGDTLLTQCADSLMRRAVSLSPTNFFYKETYARTLYYQQRLAETIAIYEDIARAKPTAQNFRVLSSLYSQSGNTQGALSALSRIERLEGRSEELAMAKFQFYHNAGDDENAFRTLEELCAEFPLDLRYRVLLGDMYDRQGQHESALYIYKDVLTLEPQNPYAQISLLAYYRAAEADSLYRAFLSKVVLDEKTQSSTRNEVLRAFCAESLKRTRYDQATLRADSAFLAPLFATAMTFPQEDATLATLNVAYLLNYNHSSEEVEAAQRRVIEISPSNTAGRLLLLQMILMRSDYAHPQRSELGEVISLCREGEVYDPADVALYYFEGLAHHRLGDNAAAIEALHRGTENVDDDTDIETASDLYALLGDLLHEQGRDDECFAAYEKSLERNPLNHLAMNNYAYFLGEAARDLNKAEAMAARVVDVEGDNTTYLDTYAWILYQQKKYAEAKIAIDRALAAAKDSDLDATIFEHAGDIYFRCGERAEAVKFWRKALPLCTDDAKQRRALRNKISRRRL